jgi:hypothetical protein
MSVFELLAGPLALVGVIVGHLMGRRDPLRYREPPYGAPVGTKMPTDIDRAERRAPATCARTAIVKSRSCGATKETT